MKVKYDAQIINAVGFAVEAVTYSDNALHTLYVDYLNNGGVRVFDSYTSMQAEGGTLKSCIHSLLGRTNLGVQVEKGSLRNGTRTMRYIHISSALPEECAGWKDGVIRVGKAAHGTVIEAAFLGSLRQNRFLFIPADAKYNGGKTWVFSNGMDDQWYAYYVSNGVVILRLLSGSKRLVSFALYNNHIECYNDRGTFPYRTFKDIMIRG